MSTPGTLWNNADVARAYREVRGVSESVRRTWRTAFRAALPDLRPRRSLDLGCGTGRFTALIAETFGGAVIGVDASVTMLEERPAARGMPLTFAAAHAGSLPLRDGAIDLVLARRAGLAASRPKRRTSGGVNRRTLARRAHTIDRASHRGASGGVRAPAPPAQT